MFVKSDKRAKIEIKKFIRYSFRNQRFENMDGLI